MGLRRNDETVQNRPVMLTSASTRIIDRINDGGSIVNMASLAGVNWPQAVADISRFIEDADFGNAEAMCEELKIEQARSYFFSKEVLIVWTMQNWNTWNQPRLYAASVMTCSPTRSVKKPWENSIEPCRRLA